jgi:type IV pilus assembly protein PilN
MARVNLLPWREAERRHRQREFVGITVAALSVTLLLGVAVHLVMGKRISNQEDRNQILRHQISLLDKQIREIQDLEKTKARLLARMDVIQQLQESRPEVVHLFDELVVDIPEGVYLTKVTQSGRSVVVDGLAQSNARVSAFMRNIEASKWIGNPSLMVIEHKNRAGAEMSHFQLRFQQLKPSSEQAEATT